MSPLYGVFKTSKPSKVDRVIISPGRYVLCKPSRDFTHPLEPPSGLKGLFHTLNATVIPTELYRLLKLSEMVDVAQRSRLGAWLRACYLFIFSSKSRGVYYSNSTPVLNFSFP
ncbi:hypothetical protein Tco_0730777 [Tanacetum coccineum]